MPAFIPPPPPPPPPFFAAPPPPPQRAETPVSPSSMEVLVDDIRTASPSSTASFSTYFEPSPPISPHLMGLDDVDQRSMSPSIFAGMYQNGQDMLWHLRRGAQNNINSYDELENSDGDGDSVDVDNDGVDVDDDVIFVANYQRPDDIRASTIATRLFDMEERVRAAEQRYSEIERILYDRIGRTSCIICTNDFLTRNTLRMPCGHLGCSNCLEKIERDAYDVSEIKCPQCRGIYISTNNCMQIIFP